MKRLVIALGMLCMFTSVFADGFTKNVDASNSNLVAVVTGSEQIESPAGKHVTQYAAASDVDNLVTDLDRFSESQFEKITHNLTQILDERMESRFGL